MALGDPFDIGYQSGAAGLSSLGQGLQTAASAFAKRKEESDRSNAELKKQRILLGEEYRLKGKFEKEKTGLKTQEESDKLDKTQKFISNLLSGGNLSSAQSTSGIGVTGYTVDPATGGVKIQFGQTPEARIQEQSKIARAKESETTIGKAQRLQVIGDTVKNEWLKTSPYKGSVTKTGLVPVLGQWDILKKGLGATSAQRQDQAYSNFIQGIRAQLARGMGDVGNLSVQEQNAVIQLVPNLYDSYESGILKLGQLSQLVENIKKNRETILSTSKLPAGYSPDEWEIVNE